MDVSRQDILAPKLSHAAVRCKRQILETPAAIVADMQSAIRFTGGIPDSSLVDEPDSFNRLAAAGTLDRQMQHGVSAFVQETSPSPCF